MKSDPGPFETSLIERCETAWRTPYRELTCEQVRTLLSQRMGIHWLATPILGFNVLYPAATITNYPGEMVLLSLRAATDLLAAAPDTFRNWLSGDFDWFAEVFGWDKRLLGEAEAALGSARELVAGR